MKSVEFLKVELKKLHESFSSITLKYAFDWDIEAHVVEITPYEQYEYNKDLENKWIELKKLFIKTYPNEAITFITDDSILKIDNAEFTLLPVFSSIFDSASFDSAFVGISPYIETSYNIEIDPVISIVSVSDVVSSYLIKDGLAHSDGTAASLINKCLIALKDISEDESIGQMQYAMAA